MTDTTKSTAHVVIRYSLPGKRGSRSRTFQGRLADEMAQHFASRLVKRDKARVLRWTRWQEVEP